jgi:hypothetical protein
MSESLEKLSLYKTAYSPMYECYVGILKVYPDVDGVAIIKARLAGEPEGSYILFREHELTNFVL